MNRKSVIWAVLKLYKWRLLLLALAILTALIIKNYTIADAKPSGGGAPNPNIDPL